MIRSFSSPLTFPHNDLCFRQAAHRQRPRQGHISYYFATLSLCHPGWVSLLQDVGQKREKMPRRGLDALVFPGKFLVDKIAGLKKQQQEQSRRKVTERELAHLHHKIVSGMKQFCFLFPSVRNHPVLCFRDLAVLRKGRRLLIRREFWNVWCTDFFTRHSKKLLPNR